MQGGKSLTRKSERYPTLYQAGENQDISQSEVVRGDSPLNAKLDTESTGGELAECIRDDPERNK